MRRLSESALKVGPERAATALYPESLPLTMETVQRKKSAHCDTLTPGQNAEVSDDERFSRLAPYELAWQSRQPFLQSRGYTLRPRYRPGWIPSWRHTGAHPSDCEDGTVFGVRVKHIERGHDSSVSL